MGSEFGSEAAQKLCSLQSSYTFSSSLQTGPLNPSTLGCTDPLLPQSTSCHHPQLASPGSRSTHPNKPFLATRRGLGCTLWSSHPKSQAPITAQTSSAGQRSFRKWGQGAWAAYAVHKPIPLPFAHAVGTGQHSLSTCPRGLVAVQGAACLWVVTLKLEVLGKHGCGDRQTLAARGL